MLKFHSVDDRVSIFDFLLCFRKSLVFRNTGPRTNLLFSDFFYSSNKEFLGEFLEVELLDAVPRSSSNSFSVYPPVRELA